MAIDARGLGRGVEVAGDAVLQRAALPTYSTAVVGCRTCGTRRARCSARGRRPCRRKEVVAWLASSPGHYRGGRVIPRSGHAEPRRFSGPRAAPHAHRYRRSTPRRRPPQGPTGPCSGCGSMCVVISPPPRRRLRRLSLPASAIHSSGASGSSAIACGSCNCAMLRGPSTCAEVPGPLPQQRLHGVVAQLQRTDRRTRRIAHVQRLLHRGQGHRLREGGRRPMPVRHGQLARACAEGEQRTPEVVGPDLVVAGERDVQLVVGHRDGARCVEHRRARIRAPAPSVGVPRRPLPHSVSMSPLRRLIRRTAWLPVSATYSMSRSKARPCGQLNEACPGSPSIRSASPVPNSRRMRPAWLHSSTRWWPLSAT